MPTVVRSVPPADGRTSSQLMSAPSKSRSKSITPPEWLGGAWKAFENDWYWITLRLPP